MRYTTIGLPNACHESWAAMTLDGTGRHCAKCQETVVDFTRMTDAEIVVFLRKYPAVSCGRFRDSQLNRPLLSAAQPVGGWRRWLGATVALLGLGSLAAPKALAQSTAPTYWGGPAPAASAGNGTAPSSEKQLAASSLPEAAPEGNSLLNTNSLEVRGIVHDRLGFRLAGARAKVRIGGTVIEASTTDEHGAFRMVVPKRALADGATIRVMSAARNENYDFYLLAEVPLEPARIKPYHIHLKKHERVRGGKFR